MSKLSFYRVEYVRSTAILWSNTRVKARLHLDKTSQRAKIFDLRNSSQTLNYSDGGSSHGGARRRSHGSSVSPLAFSVSRHGTHPLPRLLSPVLPRRILAGPARSSSSVVSFSFFIFVLECNGCVVFVCKTQCLWWRFDYWRSSAFHLGQLYQQSEYLSLRICLDAEKNGGEEKKMIFWIRCSVLFWFLENENLSWSQRASRIRLGGVSDLVS